MEKSELSCVAVGNAKWYSSLEKRQFLVRINDKDLLHNPVISILGIYTTPKMKIYVHTMTYGIQVFITALITAVVHPYNGILLSNEEEWMGVSGGGIRVLRS